MTVRGFSCFAAGGAFQSRNRDSGKGAVPVFRSPSIRAVRTPHQSIDLFDFQIGTFERSLGCDRSVAEAKLLGLNMTELADGQPNLDYDLVRMLSREFEELFDQARSDRKFMHNEAR